MEEIYEKKKNECLNVGINFNCVLGLKSAACFKGLRLNCNYVIRSPSLPTVYITSICELCSHGS